MSPRQSSRPKVKIDNFVRRHTSEVDVETLHQKGFRRINTLTFSQVNDLVATAVSRALAKYGRLPQAADTGRIREEAADAVLRQVRSMAAGTTGSTAERSPDARRIEILERRIAKLREHVAQLECALRKLDERSDARGVPSVFREVQGLRETDVHYETKKTLLRIVFEENLKLQCKATSTLPEAR